MGGHDSFKVGSISIRDVVFVSVEVVKEIHDAVILLGGGSPGVRDKHLLESAVYAPENGYYNSLAELAAVYIHGIAKNHAFIDGNKRTAFEVGEVFLRTNNHGLPKNLQWEDIMVKVATDEISREELAKLLARDMGGDVEVF